MAASGSRPALPSRDDSDGWCVGARMIVRERVLTVLCDSVRLKCLCVYSITDRSCLLLSFIYSLIDFSCN